MALSALCNLSFESVIFFSIPFLVLLIAVFRLARNDDRRLPPGRQGWPLVRENISFLSARRHGILHFLQPRISRYGRIFTTHLFGKRSVVSADANFNKWVLQNEGKLFMAKYPKGLSEIIGKYGMLSIHGDLHRKLHGIAVKLLGMDKLKAHFLAEVDSMVRRRVHRWVGREIFLQDECRTMVLELMLKHLLGIDPSEESNAIEKEFRDVTSSGVGVLPIRLPGTKFYRALKAREKLAAKMNQEIRKREQNPDAMREDLLSRLLKEEGRLPDEVIIDFVLFLVHAGHHTSARALTFAVKHLTENPDVLQKLREEHDAIVKSKNDDRLTWENYKSMKFTRWVINETLRVDIGAPMVIREALEDVPANGYVIPKGTSVILAIDAVHKDMDNYESPLAFNPWRWQSLELQKKPLIDGIFAPFSGGPRLCPGAQFAQMEVAVFLHYFVTNCRWEKAKEDQVVKIPAPIFVGGFPIRVHPREA